KVALTARGLATKATVSNAAAPNKRARQGLDRKMTADGSVFPFETSFICVFPICKGTLRYPTVLMNRISDPGMTPACQGFDPAACSGTDF
ncbi:MAG: hypothetical protein ACOC0Q_07015, partial [Wenzhouxiangella sp.]